MGTLQMMSELFTIRNNCFQLLNFEVKPLIKKAAKLLFLLIDAFYLCIIYIC